MCVCVCVLHQFPLAKTGSLSKSLSIFEIQVYFLFKEEAIKLKLADLIGEGGASGNGLRD